VHTADNLPPSSAITKSGNFNFLEPSGPVQACNGAALPLPFYCSNKLVNGMWDIYIYIERERD